MIAVVPKMMVRVMMQERMQCYFRHAALDAEPESTNSNPKRGISHAVQLSLRAQALNGGACSVASDMCPTE